MRIEKRKIPKTPEEAIKEAKRYYKNAKEILKETPIEYGIIYSDSKPVREACAIGYLAVLFAIDSFILKKGKNPDELPKDFNSYMEWLSKIPRNGKLKVQFYAVYDILHLYGYYRGGIEVNAIKSGFKHAKNMIDTFAKLIS